MKLLKYVLNHEDKFTYPKFCFLFVLFSLFVLTCIEILNVFQLLFWSTVEFTVIYLMAFKIITWVPGLYYNSLLDDYLKEKLFKAYSTLQIDDKKIKWSDRDMGNKAGRFMYKFFRVIYVSIIFYFQPFILMIYYFLFVS